MAEFSEVMRQFDRMCKAHAGCVDCRLATKGSTETKCSIGSFIDESEYVEREIMEWAAEHPEPVYPSIAKYLERFGIIIRRDGSLEADFFRANEPMSAYMANLLGISPEEGENEKAD